jgi:heme/copper-type cytochrome/quinol oxidase subunit 2
MRRLGTILMIIGANLAIGAIAVAFYVAALGCAIGEVDGLCEQGAFGLFIDLMGSPGGLIFWLVIIAGLVVLWKGRRMRARATD